MTNPFKQTLFLNLFLCLAFLSFNACEQKGTLQKATDLTISEGFTNPLGFYTAAPTFSWKLPVLKDNKRQTAYQIVVASSSDLLPDNADLWDSEKQETDQSVWVKYKGKSLESRQKVYWQVKYWNQDADASVWSDINHFELGLLSNKDWQAKWIGLDTKKENLMGSQNNIIHRPQYLRKEFDVTKNVASARLYITAKGVFDVSINGEDVSDDVMPPGYTPYKERIETITYDVSDLLESGQNTIGVEVAAGWHSGRLGWKKSLWIDTESPKLICQLELTMKDGSQAVITSDESWKGTTNGPIRVSEIYDGETYNANLEMNAWTTNSFDDNTWETKIW